jgi:hypothetical protein
MTDDERLAELKRIVSDIAFYNTSLATHENNVQRCWERLGKLQRELLSWWNVVITLSSDDIGELLNQARAIYKEKFDE